MHGQGITIEHKTNAIMCWKKNNGVQTNKWSGKNFSRGYTSNEYDVLLVDVAWNRLENNSVPVGMTAIQSSLIQNFGVRLSSDYKRRKPNANKRKKPGERDGCLLIVLRGTFISRRILNQNLSPLHAFSIL